MNSYNELIEEIKSKGFNIESIDDLINMTKREKYLVPIILRYIKLFEDDEDKSWLVRTLGVKGFNEATETLIDEFYKASNDSSLKWTIGNTLSIILDKNHIADIIKIVKERGHGTSRQMFVIALGKMKDKKVIPVLLELLNDNDLTGHAIIALSYFNDNNLISYIEPFKNHKTDWIRKEAEKAIKKIEKIK